MEGVERALEGAGRVSKAARQASEGDGRASEAVSGPKAPLEAKMDQFKAQMIRGFTRPT